MSDIFKIGFRLFVITAISAVLLGVTNMVTEGPIEQQRSSGEAREAVLPEAQNFSQLEIIEDSAKDDKAQIIEIDAGTVGNDPVGYVFKVTSDGFGGDMEIIVGINEGGEVENIQIGEHQETPGVGAKIEEEVFTDQYRGKKTESPIGVSKSAPGEQEVLAISGGTITSEAVTHGVNLATKYYEEVLKDGGEGR